MEKILIAACVAFAVGGCGEPRYPDNPVNSVRISGPFGRSLSIVNRADTSLMLDGLKYNKATGEFELKHGEIISEQSKNQRELIGWMREYANQQAAYAQIRAVEWQGLNQAIATGASVLGPYLGGKLSVEEAKAARPKLINEVIGLLGSGLDVPSLIGNIQSRDPQLAVDIAARVNELRSVPIRPATVAPLTGSDTSGTAGHGRAFITPLEKK